MALTSDPAQDSKPAVGPGPWTVGERPNQKKAMVPIRSATGALVALTHKGRVARLIAAAPALLKAARETFECAPSHGDECEGVVEFVEGEIFDDTKGCTCYLAQLRAAITLAEPVPS